MNLPSDKTWRIFAIAMSSLTACGPGVAGTLGAPASTINGDPLSNHENLLRSGPPRWRPGSAVRFRVSIDLTTDARHERLQVDDDVSIDRADGLITTTELLSHAFGESDASEGWSGLDGLLISSTFDNNGLLARRYVTSTTGDLRDGAYLDQYFSTPILRFDYLPPTDAHVGEMWTSRTIHRGERGNLSHETKVVYTLRQIESCGQRMCAVVEAREEENYARKKTSGQQRFVVDLDSLQLMSLESVEDTLLIHIDNSGERSPYYKSHKRISVEKIHAPSERPHGMSDEAATLSVLVAPGATVVFDGRSSSSITTPVNIRLRPGHYRIRLVNPKWNKDETVEVDLFAGKATVVERDWCLGLAQEAEEVCRNVVE